MQGTVLTFGVGKQATDSWIKTGSGSGLTLTNSSVSVSSQRSSKLLLIISSKVSLHIESEISESYRRNRPENGLKREFLSNYSSISEIGDADVVDSDEKFPDVLVGVKTALGLHPTLANLCFCIRIIIRLLKSNTHEI